MAYYSSIKSFKEQNNAVLENGIKRDAGYLVIAPAISKWRPLFLNADDFSHVLIGRISGHKIIIR